MLILTKVLHFLAFDTILCAENVSNNIVHICFKLIILKSDLCRYFFLR